MFCMVYVLYTVFYKRVSYKIENVKEKKILQYYIYQKKFGHEWTHTVQIMLFKGQLYSIIWIYILFTHSSADEPWGCFHFLAIMTNVAMNIPVQVFRGTCIFSPLGYVTMTGIGGSYGKSMLNDLRKCQTTLQSSVSFYITM